MKLNIKNGIIQNDNILGAPFKRGIVPFVTKRHRPGTKSNKTSITIHNTDNTLITATAENHRILLTNLEKEKINTSLSKNQVSWHFVVDDIQIIQNIPIDEVSHCQGHPKGNVSSISIEICDNYYNYDREKYLRAEDNAAKLAGSLLETLGLNTIYQHYNWTGKNCPSKIRRENRWNNYVSKINSYKGQSSISGTNPTEPPKQKEDDNMDCSNRALIVYNNVADLDNAMPLIKWLEGSYIVDLINGKSFNKHDFKCYKDCNWRIAIGGNRSSYTSYINYHITGKSREETAMNILDFRNHAKNREKYRA